MIKQKTYIMLGRAGDIINLLPVTHYEFKKSGIKPNYVIAKNYYKMLKGLSYVNPVPFDVDFKDINIALYRAKTQFPDTQIFNCAVFGKGFRINKECNSFLREAWTNSRCPRAFGTLPLIFDNRNPVREKKLIDKLIGNDDKRPILLTALRGNSSPYKDQ